MAWSHVKEILNTRLLVSLHHCWNRSANMEIFEVSQKGKARKVYSFEEIKGGNNQISYANNNNPFLKLPGMEICRTTLEEVFLAGFVLEGR